MNWHLFTAIPSLAFLTGCATQPGDSIARTDPTAVRLFLKAPYEPYESLGRVQAVERNIHTKVKRLGDMGSNPDRFQTQDLNELKTRAITALRAQAAAKGAEGVILTNLKIYAPQTDTWTDQMDEFIVMEGLAIRLKVEVLTESEPTLDALPPLMFTFLPPEAYSKLVARNDSASSASEGRPLAAAPGLPANGESPPAVMEPYAVRDRPVQSFGFSVRISRDWLTKLVDRMAVEAVAEGSAADKAGLSPQATILKINGKPVTKIVASFARGSEINRALMNREPGDRVTLEIMDVGSTAPRTVTLTESWH